jgi:hypothetical protein
MRKVFGVRSGEFPFVRTVEDGCGCVGRTAGNWRCAGTLEDRY